ncbi:MAG: hypothetical protein WDM77_19405 [Steroidobacteraceae bacterium]
MSEVLGHLALTKRVIQRRVDELWLDAEAGRLVTIDDQRHLGAVGLLIRGHIAQLRQLLQCGQQFRRPGIELFEVRILQGVLVLGFGSSCRPC